MFSSSDKGKKTPQILYAQWRIYEVKNAMQMKSRNGNYLRGGKESEFRNDWATPHLRVPAYPGLPK